MEDREEVRASRRCGKVLEGVLSVVRCLLGGEGWRVGRRGGAFLCHVDREARLCRFRRMDRELGLESVRVLVLARVLALELVRKIGAEGETSEEAIVPVAEATVLGYKVPHEYTFEASESRPSLVLLMVVVKTCVTRLESSRVMWELVAWLDWESDVSDNCSRVGILMQSPAKEDLWKEAL